MRGESNQHKRGKYSQKIIKNTGEITVAISTRKHSVLAEKYTAPVGFLV